MVDIVANRYVKALVENSSLDELKVYLAELKVLSEAFKDEDFEIIVQSPQVSEEQKIEILVSCVEDMSKKVKNLIKLLSEHKKLEIIPFIKEKLVYQIFRKWFWK
jgi:F-type H+-transporting ATPase subunit delta